MITYTLTLTDNDGELLDEVELVAADGNKQKVNIILNPGVIEVVG